ncbi:MAG TPA: hypothetical protein VK936_01530 [Longimicrobiales bacterium]|nr:hypothetical protein [Longimicrobiales bacterium]
MKRMPFILLVGALLAACGAGAGTTGLTDERFTAVVVDLRRAAEETRGNPGAFPARRDAVLQAAGVTEDQLRAYVDRHAGDLRHMAGIWADVNRRLAEQDDI